jgi:hypothetical protein
VPRAYPPFTLECRANATGPGCGNRWTSDAGPRKTVRCPACDKPRGMPASRPATAAAARAADQPDDSLTALWAAEQPPASWRDSLGADAGKGCGQCGRPMRWTGAHTAIICASCQQWSISPGVRGRVAAYAAALDQRANRTAARSADPTAERDRRAEVDRAAIELARRKGVILSQLAALRSDTRLHPDSLPVVEWFAAQVRAADRDERLDELADRLAESGIRRRHWWQGAPELEAGDDYDDYDDEDQADDLGELDGEPERAAITDGRERAGAAASAPICEWCHAAGLPTPAVARVYSPQLPSMIPERDVCGWHYDDHAALIERQTFAELIVLRRYGHAPGVHSIVKVA